MRIWLILAALGLAGAEARAGDVPLALAPPAEVAGSTSTSAASSSVESKADSVSDVAAPAEKIPSDGGQPDSVHLKIPQAAADVPEVTPAYFRHVEDLRRRHDPVMAIDYLRKIVANAGTLPQDRSRAIIELADTLESRGETAEALCWLKVWSEMFPGRREFAAVAYRMAALYTRMGMPDLARDAYYLTLSHAVDQGRIVSGDDLVNYNRLTTATLWSLAANEYQAAQWSRAAELFARYQHDATAPSMLSLEKAAFLQADCYYQLRRTDDAIRLYEETLTKHPFNPLAPQARLRLYHLDMIKNEPGQAQSQLEAMVWTVRTLWPKDETYWQKQTAQLLLAVNQKNADVLPPLVKQAAQLPPEGKTWQDVLNHYDALVSYEVVKSHAPTDKSATTFSNAGDPHTLEESQALLAMDTRLNEVLPPQPSTPQSIDLP